jgi:hypothetical protein
VFIVLLTTMPVWAQSYSHARAVRLSFVEGNVTVERPDVQGWAEAPVNTPLQQGFKLSTGESSFAEIQFENGGAIRLGEQSLIDFTELALDSSGGKINRVELRQGYATFHPLPSHLGESLQVGTPLGKLTAQGGAEFRVDLDQGLERVEVINGSVEEQSNLGSMTIEKDSVLVMQPGAPEPTTVSQGITQDDWDRWVADREAHVEMPATGPSPDGYSGDADETPYGWADLAQNGNWIDVQGEGYGWIPNSSAGWAPYSSGQWCWYPGWGYTWIGAEPWGWLPYHFGAWEFVPGIGWLWFPGSLRTWSPGQVTWYQGPNWVGWIPRPHRKNPNTACGNNCGGGVVSTGTFRHGGRLTPNRMLGINPTTGTTVNVPGISPSTTAMLPGAPVALPAAQSHGFRWNTPQPQVGTGIPATANTAPGSRRTGTTNPNSGIVYDPQQGSYVNGRRTTRPLVQPAFPAGPARPVTLAPSLANPAANSGLTQPVPVEGRQPVVGPVGGQGMVQPNSGVYASPRPVPSTPNNTPPGARPTGGVGQAGTSQAGTSHGGGWAPAESHASSAPAGGAGHGGPAGGGTAGGGHSAPAGGGTTGGHH